MADVKYHGSQRWTLYETFTDWVIGQIDELPEEVLKEVKITQLISIFSRVPKLLYFSNKYLNKYETFSLPVLEVAKFIRKLCIENKVQRKDIWWFSNLVTEDKIDVVSYLKLLKPYEKRYYIKQFNIKKQEIPSVQKTKRKTKKDKLVDEVLENQDVFEPKVKKSIAPETFSKDNDICRSCTLYNQPQVLFDTNAPDLTSIDILFIAEAPGATEVERGIPLIGMAGQKLREFVSTYIEPNGLKYFMTNVCLCRPPENRAPTTHEINCCSGFLETVIDTINPKLIVALGATAKTRLNINKSGLLNTRGFYKYKDYDVFLTVHPSYIMRKHDNSIYEEDFQSILEFFSIKQNTVQEEFNKVEIVSEIRSPFIQQVNGEYTIKIPDQYYNMSLVNIEKFGQQVIYTFRDQNDRKIYYKTPAVFYYYMKDGYGPSITYDKTGIKVVEGNPVYNHPPNITLYESDIPIDIRHSVDYNFVKGELTEYNPHILYFDIEVYSPTGEFTDPSEATNPISLISVKLETPYKTYTRAFVNSSKFNIQVDNAEVYFVKDEKELIERFILESTQNDVDIVTAWNISFDYPYIAERMKRLKMNPNLLSPLKLPVKMDSKTNTVIVPGLITPDLLTYYKILTTAQGTKSSYALDNIAKIELGEGKTEGHGELFYIMWETDKPQAVKYNIDDVNIISNLNNKLDIIQFFNDMRIVSSCPWQYLSMNTMFIDAMNLLFAKTGGRIYDSLNKN
jgi:DNA polymerase